MDGLVHAHHVKCGLVRALNAHHAREVACPVKVAVRWQQLSLLVQVAVDGGGNAGQLGDEIERVLVDGVPVLTLVDTCTESHYLLDEVTRRQVSWTLDGAGLAMRWRDTHHLVAKQPSERVLVGAPVTGLVAFLFVMNLEFIENNAES